MNMKCSQITIFNINVMMVCVANDSASFVVLRCRRRSNWHEIFIPKMHCVTWHRFFFFFVISSSPIAQNDCVLRGNFVEQHTHTLYFSIEYYNSVRHIYITVRRIVSSSCVCCHLCRCAPSKQTHWTFVVEKSSIFCACDSNQYMDSG